MKKTILAIMACLCTTAGFAQDWIEVSTGEEFLRALGSNRTIKVVGNINLTDVFKNNAEWLFGQERVWDEDDELGPDNLPTKEPAVIAERVFDGFTVVIANMKHLKIEAWTPDRVIYVEPRYAEVLKFVNCEDITVGGIALGHTDDGNCTGGVLGFYGCKSSRVYDSDLYGCGYTGVIIHKSEDMLILDSNIRDCTGDISQVRESKNVDFNNCYIYRNQGSAWTSESSQVKFTSCTFTQNGPYLFAGDTMIDVHDCEIHLDDSGEEPYDITDFTAPATDNRISYDRADPCPTRPEAKAGRRTTKN